MNFSLISRIHTSIQSKTIVFVNYHLIEQIFISKGFFSLIHNQGFTPLITLIMKNMHFDTGGKKIISFSDEVICCLSYSLPCVILLLGWLWP